MGVSLEEQCRQVGAGSVRASAATYRGLSIRDRLALQAAERVALWRMTRNERLAAYRAGELTAYQRGIWAANCPDEVPLVNGEYPWIVATLADIVEEGER